MRRTKLTYISLFRTHVLHHIRTANVHNRPSFKTSLYIYIFQDEKSRLMRNLSLSMIISGDNSSIITTWSISNTGCQKWTQIERLGFYDPGPYPEQKSIIKITNILLSMKRITVPNLKLFFGIIKGVLFISKTLTVFKTMSGFPSGGHKGGYWGYLPPPRILGVNTPLESWG